MYDRNFVVGQKEKHQTGYAEHHHRKSLRRLILDFLMTIFRRKAY